MNEYIEFINSFFINVDENKWDLVTDALADKVWIDYESMTGEKGTTKSNGDIVEGWSQVLPGYKATHHQVSNYIVTTEVDAMHVTLYGTTWHYIPNPDGDNVEVIVGKYDMDLNKIDGKLKIVKIVFNLKFKDGNSQLETMAAANVKQKKEQ